MKRKRTGSSRFYFYFILSILVIFFASFGIRSLVTKMSFFNISDIKVYGNYNLETEFLSNISKDLLGKNIYLVSKKDVLKKYENIIRIKDVKVSRLFPNKLKIKIIEKIGLFFIKTSDGKFFPIDEKRTVLDNDNFYLKEILPIIETDIPTSKITFGSEIENEFVERVFELSKIIKAENTDFINNISEFYCAEDDIFMVEANTGYRIVFGVENIEGKLKKYSFLEQNRTFKKETIIDLRFQDQLVIRSEAK
ncbi:MAG: FtsQ-type POTRA domain-containing protein [Candidatus Cloacimonetes bacterium]|nr:FtsQ-type POTRA domain-containing protein [Candidatus Cloacimonadota bacterium]